MTLSQMLAMMYRGLRYTTAPPAPIIVRCTDEINQAYRDLLSQPNLERLREDTIPVVAFLNQARSGLPYAVARIQGITDRTNNFKLQQLPLKELRTMDPAQAFTGGYPMRYAVIGDQAVVAQPAAATGLWVASTAAGDTTQKVYVETITTGGYPQQTITAGTALNGVTRIQIGTAVTHIAVEKFYLDTPATGYVSLYDAAAAGNELARLPIGVLFGRYLAVEWWPVPTANVTEYADITRQMFDLVNGFDEPLLPVDFHNLIVTGAMVQEYEVIDDRRLGVARLDWAEGVKRLQAWVMNDGDQMASLRPIVTRWNNLGGNYPATNCQ